MAGTFDAYVPAAQFSAQSDGTYAADVNLLEPDDNTVVGLPGEPCGVWVLHGFHAESATWAEVISERNGVRLGGRLPAVSSGRCIPIPTSRLATLRLVTDAQSALHLTFTDDPPHEGSGG